MDLNGGVRFSDIDYNRSQTDSKDEYFHQDYKHINQKHKNKQIKQPVSDNRYSETEKNDVTKTNSIAPILKSIKFVQYIVYFNLKYININKIIN